jgi:hypothetical protein
MNLPKFMELLTSITQHASRVPQLLPDRPRVLLLQRAQTTTSALVRRGSNAPKPSCRSARTQMRIAVALLSLAWCMDSAVSCVRSACGPSLTPTLPDRAHQLRGGRGDSERSESRSGRGGRGQSYRARPTPAAAGNGRAGGSSSTPPVVAGMNRSHRHHAPLSPTTKARCLGFLPLQARETQFAVGETQYWRYTSKSPAPESL